MMKKFSTIIIAFSFIISGCSTPVTSVYKQIYSFNKETIKVKGGMGKTEVNVWDFREREAYEEDIENFQAKVEEYISSHPNLDEQEKLSLRAFKVAPGSKKVEVEFLLGKPDKVIDSTRNDFGASQIWLYRIYKLRAFTVFIFPVLFMHESYYLYFKDDTLAGIERHHLQQNIGQGSAPGVNDRVKSSN